MVSAKSSCRDITCESVPGSPPPFLFFVGARGEPGNEAIWYVRIPYIHSALFVRDAIFPHCALFHVASHSCSRDKTNRTGT